MAEVLEFFKYPYEDVFGGKDMVCCTQNTFDKLKRALKHVAQERQIPQNVVRRLLAQCDEVYVDECECVAFEKCLFDKLFAAESVLTEVVSATVVELSAELLADQQ